MELLRPDTNTSIHLSPDLREARRFPSRLPERSARPSPEPKTPTSSQAAQRATCISALGRCLLLLRSAFSPESKRPAARRSAALSARTLLQLTCISAKARFLLPHPSRSPQESVSSLRSPDHSQEPELSWLARFPAATLRSALPEASLPQERSARRTLNRKAYERGLKRPLFFSCII